VTLKIHVKPRPGLSSIGNAAAHGSVEDPDDLEVLGIRNKHTSKYHKKRTSSAGPTHMANVTSAGTTGDKRKHLEDNEDNDEEDTTLVLI